MICEVAVGSAAGVVRARDQGSVGKPDPALGDQLGDHQLDRREVGHEPPQAAVVLRLVGQVREPAGQQPVDHPEELAVRWQADRRLSRRERDQLLVGDLPFGPLRGIESESANT